MQHPPPQQFLIISVVTSLPSNRRTSSEFCDTSIVEARLSRGLESSGPSSRSDRSDCMSVAGVDGSLSLLHTSEKELLMVEGGERAIFVVRDILRDIAGSSGMGLLGYEVEVIGMWRAGMEEAIVATEA